MNRCAVTVFLLALARLAGGQQLSGTLPVPGTPAQADLDQARSAAERGRLPEAEQQTRAYLASRRDSAAGHFLLGYILFREVKTRESLAEYTEGAKYQRPSAQDLLVVGSDYVLLGDYEDADKWFSKAVQWEPSSVIGWYYLGRTKYNENRFEEAIHAFEQCLNLSPRHIRAEDNLALSLQALNRDDEAQTTFLKALEWEEASNAKDPWPYIDFGTFLVERNQAEKAISYLQKAVGIMPGSPSAHQELGKAYLALKQLDKAQGELEEAVKLEPGNARAHYVLGQLYERVGQGEKAKQEFARYSQLKNSQSDEASREYHPKPNE